ncbi:hypothetical protein KKJ04_14870 [Xenorhabdus bovienii]|uniref:hypothetical protein n=1 Tax=Xenorhabdus bovienii TaxID=40576 RepID=UPI0023B2B679|nr:hypothetical protein [Xenorhabdus bovienii]MDE9446851.1 hypothetical protein [Xenorhabdus bovienii]
MLGQNRITLTSLKIAEFASEETTCFEAKLRFDGKIIGTAQNDGKGGCTLLYPVAGKKQDFEAAKKYAESLPALEIGLPDDKGAKIPLVMDLELLVDELVIEKNRQKKIRAKFKRDFPKKIMFVRDGKVFSINGIELRTENDKAIAYQQVRKINGKNIVILSELPEDEAFELYVKAMQ